MVLASMYMCVLTSAMNLSNLLSLGLFSYKVYQSEVPIYYFVKISTHFGSVLPNLVMDFSQILI